MYAPCSLLAVVLAVATAGLAASAGVDGLRERVRLPSANADVFRELAASRVLSPARQEPPEAARGTPKEACLDSSLSWPRWLLYDPQFTVLNYDAGGRHGNIAFAAFNTGTRKQHVCQAKDIDLVPTASGEHIWYNCSVPDTTFWFDIDTFGVGLKQQWSCDNYTSEILFTGTGSTEIPLTLGCFEDEIEGKGIQTSCLTSNADISMSLSSPVAIDPVPPYLTYVNEFTEDRCVDRSGYPAWDVQNLMYENTGKDGNHTLSFNLTNLSNDESVSCSVVFEDRLSLQNTNAEHWVTCVAPKPSLSEAPIIATQVMFDADYNLLVINQTWRCDDGVKGVEADIYAGIAYHVQKLDCGSEVNARGAYFCTMPQSIAAGYEYGWEPLLMPHTTYTHSCTLNSFNSTSLVLSGYKIDVTDSAQKKASFNVFNPATLDEYKLRDMAVVDDGVWHTCELDDLPWQLAACEYMLDRETSNIGFRLEWFCDDRDPNHAVLFNVKATGNFPKEVCGPQDANGAAQPGTACKLPSNADVSLSIGARTWTSTRKPMGRGPPLPWI